MPGGYPSASSSLLMKPRTSSSSGGLAARLRGAFTDQSIEARSGGAANALPANTNAKPQNGIGKALLRMLNYTNQARVVEHCEDFTIPDQRYSAPQSPIDLNRSCDFASTVSMRARLVSSRANENTRALSARCSVTPRRARIDHTSDRRTIENVADADIGDADAVPIRDRFEHGE